MDIPKAHPKWKSLCSLRYHSFFVGLGSLGSLLLGIAACMALWNTDILDKMTSIREAVNNTGEAVNNTREAVNKIQEAVNKIQEAVDNLRDERKEVTTRKRLPLYKEKFSLKEEDKDKKRDFSVQEQALKELLPDEKSNLKAGDIYLHSKDLPLLKEKLQALKELLPDKKSNLKAGDIYLHSKDLPLLKEKRASNDQIANRRAERFLKEKLQIWSPNDKGKKN